MIDYLALFIGHFLLAIALLHLVQREALDIDPLLTKLSPAKKPRQKQRARGKRAREKDRPAP